MIVIDSDVLLLAFAFHRDPRQETNAAFLQQAQLDDPAVAIYSVMEVLGKLSFNLSPERLEAWSSWLIAAYQLTVIWPIRPRAFIQDESFHDEIFARPFAKMQTYQMPFLDALILNLAERAEGATHFITWNARHFQGKSTLSIMTPTDYINQSGN